MVKQPAGVNAGSEVVQVSPEQAYKWLEGNMINRHIRQQVVNRYAADMKRGNWQLTHQGIAFDEDGVLLDGQHRLWAVIESGRTVPMLVTRGIPADSRLVIDAHAVRTSTDCINLTGGIDGEKITNDDLTVCRHIINGMGFRTTYTTAQFRKLMPKYIESIHWVKAAFDGRVQGVGSSYIRGVVARAWYTCDRDKLKRFARILVEGAAENDHEKMVIRLRDKILTEYAGMRAATRNERYAIVERVLLAFLKGETLVRFYPVDKEVFRVPEEMDIKRTREETTVKGRVGRRASSRQAKLLKGLQK